MNYNTGQTWFKVGHKTRDMSGDKNTFYGKNHTPEAKKKISESNLKNPRRYWLGKKRSDEDKDKIRRALVGRKVPLIVRKKISQSTMGSNSYLWRGGLTGKSKKIRSSLEYRLWRESVFERDNWTCVVCGLRSGNGLAVELNADHIKPFALFPELRLSLDNGRTLCHECHKKTDTYAGRTRRSPQGYSELGDWEARLWVCAWFLGRLRL